MIRLCCCVEEQEDIDAPVSCVLQDVPQGDLNSLAFAQAMYFFFKSLHGVESEFLHLTQTHWSRLPSLGLISCYSWGSCQYDKSWIPVGGSSGPSVWAFGGNSQGLSPFQFLLCFGPIDGVVCQHLFISFSRASFDVEDGAVDMTVLKETA